MQHAQQNQADLVIRRATPDDYPAFIRLFPELQVDDPVPALDRWAAALVPSTWIAARDIEILGYCYCQEYAETGYVRNVVVAPTARRSGVGHALMLATAESLRSHGKKSWRLNVKPDNRAALALYQRMGMRTKYLAQALCLPWAAMKALPVGDGAVREVTPDRDAELEQLFDLPRGQLAFARGAGRILLEVISSSGQPAMGLALFDPKIPSAFPFRAQAIDAVMPLLAAMRRHAPTDLHVNLVAENDEPLADLFKNAGASLRHEIIHMEGAL